MNSPLISLEDFENEIKKYDVPVLVKFWAPWCKPCEVLKPIVNKVVDHLGEQIKLLEINIDEGSNIASKCEIMSVPTIILIYKNQEIRRSGYIGFEDLINWIETFKNSVTAS